MSPSASRVGWLIGAEMFDGYRDELVAAIFRSGHEAVLVRTPAPPYRWKDVGCTYRDAFPRHACVVAHGDIELVTRVRRERLWAPGAYATIEHYQCSKYYCHFGEHLLNHRYAMLPFGELRRCQEFLFDALGVGGRIFVRPDSPLKIFTGQVVSAAGFEADLEYLGFFEFPLETMVVVSPPQAIEREWRFVVADRAVIGGSQYKRDGNNEIHASFDPAALDLAAKVAVNDFQPDRVWIADVCRTADGRYHLLEIGGFSFADLYACDKDAVAAAVSLAALADWEAAHAGR